MRKIFLAIMLVLNVFVISITLANAIQIDYLSLRVFFTAFSTVIAVYLTLLHKSKTDLVLAVLLVFIAVINAYIIADAVYHYIY